MDGGKGLMKKFITSTVLGLTLVTALGISASATSLFQTVSNTRYLPGSDSWNRGITNPGNGYYMAYSYYHNSAYSHAAEAKIDGLGTVSLVYAPGTTAPANSDSRPSYSSANIRAAAYNSSWYYVQDTGNGDFKVSGW